MEQVTVIYSLDGVSKVLSAHKVGQLAVTRAMWLDKPRKVWRVTTLERYDILHALSSLRIDTVECSYLDALKIAESLSSFDFDTFWEHTKQGVRDKKFIQDVRYAIAQASMPV